MFLPVLPLLVSIAHAQDPSPLAPDGFAISLANATDLDGDGIDDLIVGDPAPESLGGTTGAVWLLSGKDLRAIRHIQPSKASGWFGSSVATIGGVKPEDSRRILVSTVASYSQWSLYADENAKAVGTVHILSLAGTIIGELSGTAPGDRFGHCVAGAGDLDGDGIDDFLVSAPGDGHGHGGGRGVVRIYSGKDLHPLFEVRGELEAFALGRTVLVTSPSKSEGRRLLCCTGRPLLNIDSGCVRVFSIGKDARWLYTLRGRDDEHEFGAALAEIADMDGDGWPEIGVGSPAGPRSVDAPGAGGRILVVSGRTGTVLREILAPPGRRYFGTAIAQGPDLDQGGKGDLFALTSQPPESSADTLHLFGFSLAKGTLVSHLDTDGGQQIVPLKSSSGRLRFAITHCDADEGGLRGWVSLIDEIGKTASITTTRPQLLGRASRR